jgi:hypothetical protein
MNLFEQELADVRLALEKLRNVNSTETLEQRVLDRYPALRQTARDSTDEKLRAALGRFAFAKIKPIVQAVPRGEARTLSAYVMTPADAQELFAAIDRLESSLSAWEGLRSTDPS